MINIQFFGGRGGSGGKGGGGSSGSFKVSGNKISVGEDTINMIKKGAFQQELSRQTSLSADGKTSTTTITRLYKSNSGTMYEVTEKTTVRERSAAESARVRVTNPSRYRSGGTVMGTGSMGDLYQTTSEITRVKKRKSSATKK